MNRFPSRRVNKISRGGIISAEWLNALARAATESGNEAGVNVPVARIRSLNRGDAITAEFLNRIADTLEKRFRETRTPGVGDAYFFRSVSRRNFGRREFRRLRRGDAITAEWLNALVDAANELNGVHVCDRYFYFERKESVPSATTHPWKVSAYRESDAWMLKVNAATIFKTVLSGTNAGLFLSDAFTNFVRLNVPESGEFYVYFSTGFYQRSFAATAIWPLTKGNLHPLRILASIAGNSVKLGAGTVPDSFSELLIATGKVVAGSDGNISGVEINQILRSDITAGMSCEGAIEGGTV